MARLVDGVVAGGVLACLYWFTRREQAKAEAADATADRVANLAAGRAGVALAVAQGERALADGRAAAAAVAARRALTPAPPSPSPATLVPAPAAPSVAPSVAPRSAGLTRRFDDLFRIHGQAIPVAYLRALAQAESDMRPHDRLGLINVVPVALDDYNRRHPEAPLVQAQMRDPASNIRVAADILRTVIDGFRRHHADVPNLRADWRNPRFVELLTAAWNSGGSELAGVGRVVTWIMARPPALRPAEITIDAVFDAAHLAGATRHLSNPRKLAYAKGVAAAFAREVARDARDGLALDR